MNGRLKIFIFRVGLQSGAKNLGHPVSLRILQNSMGETALRLELCDLRVAYVFISETPLNILILRP